MASLQDSALASSMPGVADPGTTPGTTPAPSPMRRSSLRGKRPTVGQIRAALTDDPSASLEYGTVNHDATTESIVSVENGLPVHNWRDHKLSIFILMAVQFLSNLTFSIIIPSLVFFIRDVEGSATQDQFLNGVTIALNSAATFFFSPVCGIWTDKRSAKECLIVTSILMIGGNVLYAFSTKFWMILLGRIIVGLGAGNQVVAQVYFGWVTTNEQRSTIMSIMSLVQVLAIILGPAMAPIFENVNVPLFASFRLDKLSMPGWFSALMGLVILALLFFFDESVRPPKEVLAALNAKAKTCSDTIKEYLYPPTSANKVGVWVCIVLSFTYGVSFTVFETVGVKLTEDFYGWGSSQSGLLYTIAGLEAVVCIVITSLVARKFSDRVIVLFSSFLLAISAIPFCPFEYPFQSPVTGTPLHNGGFIQLWIFIVGAALSTAGFTLGSVLLLTLFSRITDDSSQGVWMGYFNAARALSRIGAPIAVGILYTAGGAAFVFVPSTVFMFLGLFANILGYTGMMGRSVANNIQGQPNERSRLLAGH